jgi:CRISPR/Cas system endoribonuclease Cas6 (RAMP superfamily)
MAKLETVPRYEGCKEQAGRFQEPLLYHLIGDLENRHALGVREIFLKRSCIYFLSDPETIYAGEPKELRVFLGEISKRLEGEIRQNGTVIPAEDLQKSVTAAGLGSFVLRPQN